MILDKILEELANSESNCYSKDAITQAKKEILGLIPNERDYGVRSKDHINHHFHGEAQCFECDENKGFNDCRSQILKNLNGEK
jgi:hypothetical protein